MASLTVENYVKAIYQISTGQPGQAASTGQISEALGVLPGTVTSMLKTLSEEGLATYTPYAGVSLTNSGNALALRVIRRHRLIELFLVRTLNLNWDEVHEEAENMEHAVSDRLIDKIDAFLGMPASDPHGDPIPAADGTMNSHATRSLAECKAGETFRLARVLDQSPEFLRFLSASSMILNASGEVSANVPQAGIVTVKIDGREATLGHDAASRILVYALD